ncbi:MAG: hypothetical protein GW836_18685 [Paraglaciecola sp.]|nr:hypothetical protein [Paraglaciecola sp.]
MNTVNPPKKTLQQRTKYNVQRLFIWTLAWVASLALLAIGPRNLWAFEASFSLAALALNLLIGLKMILVNKQHLLGLDELQRRVQLEAMGIALGVGLVTGCALEALSNANVISFTMDVSQLIMIMSLVYITAVFISIRKYA